MGRFRYRGVKLAVAILSFWGLAACGGGRKAGSPLFAGRVSLNPSQTLSMTLGSTINFTSAVQTASGTNLNVAITFSSSDTSILNIASNGVACAGHWDIAFTTCTPGNVGMVQVTATALGASSVPTYVFVHPQIDNITVTGVLLNGLPVQEPCLSQSQSMTLEAHAYSQGTDVTASVGPFSWSANNSTVVNLSPLVSNNNLNFATNQVTARALNPGITHIYASANGVTSNSFQQPQYTENINGSQQTSPLLDFFSTCPIQNISLELGAVGSGQTSFSVTKGTTSGAVTALATVTDIMGNTSLPNTNGGIVLSKIPLTWTASQPGAINVSSACLESCGITLAGPGSGTVTASCSPPGCNAGFPEIPTAFITNGALDPTKVAACTQFFRAQFPSFIGCQGLIPTPVYSSSVFFEPPNTTIPLTPNAAISGVVIGNPGTPAVLAASTGCAQESPSACSSSVYFVTTGKAAPGGENPLPSPPNSFLFDPAGDKIFMGSDFGSVVINPTNLNSGTSPFTSLGTVLGKVLATNNTGSSALFSDTSRSPNQVYIVSSANGSGPVALNIPAATHAAFSPDGLKTFIAGGASGNLLYVYSTLQALQQFSPSAPTTNPQLSLAQPANAIAFSPNGAFAFVAESAADGSAANITGFATCNNQIAATVALPSFSVPVPHLPNLQMRVLPNLHLDGRDSVGQPIPNGIHILVLDSTGFDLVTASVSPPATAGDLCPQQLSFDSVQRIDLGQGVIQPLNFFVSGDGTQLYVVNSGSSSILVYNFIAGSTVGGIELAGGATPLSADMSADGGMILVSGSDGMLHQVTTQSGGLDQLQLSFPNLPNFYNAFCSVTPSAGPCILNVALARP